MPKALGTSLDRWTDCWGFAALSVAVVGGSRSCPAQNLTKPRISTTRVDVTFHCLAPRGGAEPRTVIENGRPGAPKAPELCARVGNWIPGVGEPGP